MSYIALSTADRRRDGEPAIALENVLLEPGRDNDPRGPKAFGLPGTVEVTLVANPVRGMFAQPGIVAGNLLHVSGNTLWQWQPGTGSTSLGIVGGTGRAQIAAIEAGVVVSSANGATTYRANAGTLHTVALPNGDLIAAMATIDQTAVYAGSGTPRLWWSQLSAPHQFATSPLPVASAVTRPDPIVGIVVVDRTLYVGGSDSVEMWRPTGRSNPFVQRVGDIAFDRGFAGRDAACAQDGALYFLASDGCVYRMRGQGPQRISTPDMDAAIGAASAASRAGAVLMAWETDGHLLVEMDVPGVGAWIFDALSEAWTRRVSVGITGARWLHYARANGVWYGAGGLQIVRVDRTTTADAATGQPQRRVWSLWQPVAGRDPVGHYAPAAEVVSGSGSLTLDWSDDGGATYGTARTLALPRPSTTLCGAPRAPGRVWRHTVTDAVRFAAYGAHLNEGARVV